MRRESMSQVHKGFTLLELSLVIVIVGLLIGGIVFGRDLIRAAQLRQLQRQVEEFSTAAQTFKSKYGCLAGDCKNATDAFGLNPGCPSDDPLMALSDTPTSETCNGDNDGKIDAKNTFYEGLTFWQQLASAGLIAGSYTGGFVTYGDSVLAPGANLPRITAVSVPATWFAGDGDTWSLFGGVSTALVPGHFGSVLLAYGLNPSNAGVLSPTDMYALDSKFDDGQAVTGRITVPNTIGSPATHCTNAADETTQDAANNGAQYLADDAAYKDEVRCGAMYLNLW